MPNSLTRERMSIDAMNSVVEREHRITTPSQTSNHPITPGTLGSLSKYGKKKNTQPPAPNHEKLCGTANSNS